MTTLAMSSLRNILLTLALISLAVAAASSQGTPAAAVSPIDTFMVVAPVRSATDIKQDMVPLDAYRSHAKARHEEIREQIKKLEAEIELKGKEIKLLEARQDLAEKEKKDAEAESLKAQISGVEQIRDLLEQRKDVCTSELDAVDAALEYAAAAQNLYDEEIVLAKKREEITAQANASKAKVPLFGSNRFLFEIENAVLEAQIKKLKKEDKAISKEQDAVEQRQKLAEMQAKYLPK
jgi:hypothetical protein